jgi:hypothetical protein
MCMPCPQASSFAGASHTRHDRLHPVRWEPWGGQVHSLELSNLHCAFQDQSERGKSMTYRIDEPTVGGTVYLDKSGLEDSSKRETAAQAINEALKKDGWN